MINFYNLRKIFFTLFTTVVSASAYSWEPTQDSPRKVSLSYALFAPFGETDIEVSIDDQGFINNFHIAVQARNLQIPIEKLRTFRYPSLADIEVMHFGEIDQESGLGGSFSICVPYGRLTYLKHEKYWQRATLSILITPEGLDINDIKLPREGELSMGINGCEFASKEAYGF